MCKKLKDRRICQIQCINLGVAATDPVHHYFRLKQVGLLCQTGTVYLFVYAGNDYLNPQQSYSREKESFLANLIAERPFPSITAQFLPELNWLVVDRLRLSQRQQNSRELPLDDENRLFKSFSKQPFGEGIQNIAKQMHDYHHPDHSTKEIWSVLTRGGQRFWNAFQPKSKDREWLQSYFVNVILNTEFSGRSYPTTIEDVPQPEIGPYVDATMSWIEATHKLCLQSGVSCKVFLIPTGIVDPGFRRFWSPWPAAFEHAVNFRAHCRHQAMSERLSAMGIPFVDLQTDLDGIPGTYRVSDWHWTEKGTEIISSRVVQELSVIDPHE